MLPLPKLDDRDYDEIREEAIRNIVRHCPEWTNHNASDPGITLVELFSSMTEMLQYRLNRVPEKNYLAFLDMLGIIGRLPSPAKTRLKFNLSEGYEMGEEKKSTIHIEKNTVVSTDDEEPIPFETAYDTKISNIKIKNIFSKVYEKDKDEYLLIEHKDSFEKKEGFIPFEITQKSTNHSIVYIYSDELEYLKDKSLISLFFRIPTGIKGFNYEIEKNFLKRLDWEYFNGEEWLPLNIADEEIDEKELDSKDAYILNVTFNGNCKDLKKSVIKDIDSKENYYVRAILRESKKWLSDFEVYEISVSTKSKKGGIVPDACNYRQSPLDLNNDFYPFGQRPKNDEYIKEDEYFYIKSDEAFSKKGAKVTINFKHSTSPDYVFPKKDTDPKLVWRYYTNNDEWKILKVIDNTSNLTSNGTVEFVIPKDMAKVDLNGDEGFWIQCKLESGDYGKEEKKEFKDGEEIIVSTSTLHPPKLSRITIEYFLDRLDIKECAVYSNYTYEKKIFGKNNIIRLFDQKKSKEQSLNICFDSYISEDYIDLYFDIDESILDQRNLKSSERILEWEILVDDKWLRLEVKDETDELTKSGIVRLNIPKYTKLSEVNLSGNKFKAMWIKAVVKSNALNKIPKINDILTNTVLALQKESFYDEYIGKSIGLPEMSFYLNHTNIIEPPKIFVGEDEYHYTKRFIEHSQHDKVYTFYSLTGEIKFGDGKYGEIPKPFEDIYAKEYAVTLGEKGNLAQDKVTTLMHSISFVESVTNITPATGGSNADSMDDLKKYAPSVFKTRDRAITIEDYESLAKSFSSNIIQAKAIAGNNGNVQVVIITKDIIEDGGFINRNLIQDLEEFLNSKSLVTVKTQVKSPTIVPLVIEVKIKSTNEQNELTKAEVEEKLTQEAKKYFSVIDGGDKGEGYPMGKNITRADMYKLLNKVDSTLFYDSISFNKGSDRVILDYNSIVKFESLTVQEFTYDG